MKIISAGGTHIGNVRTNNEDNFYINGYYKNDPYQDIEAAEDDAQREYYTYAVCDGMGGECSGEIASLKSLKALRSFDGPGLGEVMNVFTQEANEQICKEMQQSGRRMGTTLALLHIDRDLASICNIGDSRIYLLRGRHFEQLTKDHTRVQQMIEAGIIDREKARANKQRHVLTQHLGIFPEEFILDPYIVAGLPIKPADLFLLCSDGLTDMLSDMEILSCLTLCQNELPKVIVHRLVTTALKKGGKDNISVIVVKVY